MISIAFVNIGGVHIVSIQRQRGKTYKRYMSYFYKNPATVSRFTRLFSEVTPDFVGTSGNYTLKVYNYLDTQNAE